MIVVGGNEEGGAAFEMRQEFALEDVDAGKVEVAEMDVLVGDKLQPTDEVAVLWLPYA